MSSTNAETEFSNVPFATLSSVECVAPASLPGGYQLHVEVNGQPLVVLVPEGGVQEGQRFTASVLQRETNAIHDNNNNNNVNQQRASHHIPFGKWRDGLCDCFNPGCCHPSCCLAFFCGPIALGQVMTRMHMSWLGNRPKPGSGGAATGSQNGGITPFRFLVNSLILYILLDLFVDYLCAPYQEYETDENGNEVSQWPNAPTGIRVLDGIRRFVFWSFVLFNLILLIRTRKYIRSKYDIPTKQCGQCEDFCCSCWCHVCVLSQMARHTADYSVYPPACCSETGLSAGAPDVDDDLPNSSSPSAVNPSFPPSSVV